MFTTYNTRISLAIGGDLSYVGSDPNNEIPLILTTTSGNKDNFIFKETANWNLNLGFDIYSPNSLINFFLSAEFNSQNYSMKIPTLNQEYAIENWNVELPAYIKFRFGKTTGRNYLWLALGGGYSIPIKTRININATDINLFKPITYLSGLIGYEFSVKSVNDYHSSNFRLLLYVKGNYDLENRINSKALLPEDTIINQIDALEIQFLRISLGLKFLLF